MPVVVPYTISNNELIEIEPAMCRLLVSGTLDKKGGPMSTHDPDFQREAALLMPQLEEQRQLAAYKSVLQFAAIALNSSLLVNGGAAVAILAFLGSTRSSPTAPKLLLSMEAFAIGVMTALVATGLAYMTQVQYAKSMTDKLTVEHFLTVLIVFLSYVAFFVGIVLAAQGFGAQWRPAERDNGG